MRVIKFRAWDKKNGVMFQPDKVRFEFFNGLGFVEPTDKDARSIAEEFDVMQFTGLSDKNGREIYEGDIVEIRDHAFEGSIKIDGVYEVGYNERMELCCGSLLLHRQLPYFTVIGNIYEHPHLLEGGASE